MELLTKKFNFDIANKQARSFTLRTLVQKNIMAEENADFIIDLAERASRQYALETALGSMDNQWKTVTFSLDIDKESNTYKIKDTEELQRLIDDHCVKTQGIRASPHGKHFLTQVIEWEKRLMDINNIIEEIIKCQKSWI